MLGREFNRERGDRGELQLTFEKPSQINKGECDWNVERGGGGKKRMEREEHK